MERFRERSPRRPGLDALAETNFCRTHTNRIRSFAACCGTHLFFEESKDSNTIDVTIASLDDPSPFAPQKALLWVVIDESLPSFRESTGQRKCRDFRKKQAASIFAHSDSTQSNISVIFDRMNLPTKRSQRIDAYISDPNHEVPDEKVRVMLAGDVHTLKVYRIPISHLIFNIRNGRFRAELLAKEEQLKRRLDPTVETDSKIISGLLLSQDEGETEALKKDLLLHGQIDPGIITFDGAIINANRRAAILTTLLEDTHENRFEYLKVGRLPENVDEKDLWRIEAGLQFGKDFRLQYGPVNELLKLKEGRDRGLSAKDISGSLLGRFSPEKVEEKLEILKLMELYLHYIGKPGEYHIVQQERDVEKFNSLWGSVVAPLRRRNKTDPKIAKLINVAFSIIDKTRLTHWDVRELRKISENKTAYEELLKPFAGKNTKTVDTEGVIEAYTSSKEIVEDTEEKDKPERLLKKALSAVRSIDSANPRLKDPNVRAILDDLAVRVSELKNPPGI